MSSCWKSLHINKGIVNVHCCFNKSTRHLDIILYDDELYSSYKKKICMSNLIQSFLLSLRSNIDFYFKSILKNVISLEQLNKSSWNYVLYNSCLKCWSVYWDYWHFIVTLCRVQCQWCQVHIIITGRYLYNVNRYITLVENVNLCTLDLCFLSSACQKKKKKTYQWWILHERFFTSMFSYLCRYSR